MTRTAIKRCFIGLLALAFVLACMPVAAPSVTAEAAPVKLQNSTGAVTVHSTTVAFAGHEWWVIGYGSDGVYPQPGSVTLLAKNNDFGTTAFKYGGTSNDYSGSDLQAEMISIATGINTNSPKEYGLIKPRTITTTDDANNNLATAVTNQHIWPISYGEWGKISNLSDARDFESDYWLRSPSGTDSVWFGQIGGDGISTDTPGEVRASRPALSLDLSSVLLTSSADDTGKRAVTLGKTLSETEIPTGTIKLTVEDDANLKLASAAFKSVTDRDVTFTYSGATAGTTLSAIIQNKEDQQITHYGQLAVVGASGAGEAVLTLPDDYNPIYQSIMLFVEELNADTKTDFASVPLEFFVRYPVAYHPRFDPRLKH